MGAVLWSERELRVVFHSLVWPVQLGPPYTTQEPATHAVMLPLHLTTGVITNDSSFIIKHTPLFSFLFGHTRLLH